MKVRKLIWINKYQYVSTFENSFTNIGLQTDINSLSRCLSWPDLIRKPCWLLGDREPIQTSYLEVCLLTWVQSTTQIQTHVPIQELASVWLGHGSRWASVCCSLLCRYTQYYFLLQGNGDRLCFFWSETTNLLSNNTLWIYCS